MGKPKSQRAQNGQEISAETLKIKVEARRLRAARAKARDGAESALKTLLKQPLPKTVDNLHREIGDLRKRLIDRSYLILENGHRIIERCWKAMFQLAPESAPPALPAWRTVDQKGPEAFLDVMQNNNRRRQELDTILTSVVTWCDLEKPAIGTNHRSSPMPSAKWRPIFDDMPETSFSRLVRFGTYGAKRELGMITFDFDQLPPNIRAKLT
jgi:hypothetical protein